MPEVFISRQPVVNRQSKIIATRLVLHLDGGATTRDAANALTALTDVWPQGEKSFFISCDGTPCDEGLLAWQAPQNATIELQGASFAVPNPAPLLDALQATQPSLCLNFDENVQSAINSGLPFRFVSFDAQRFPAAQLKMLAAKTHALASALPSMSSMRRRSRPALTPVSMPRPAGSSRIPVGRRPRHSTRGRHRSSG